MFHKILVALDTSEHSKRIFDEALDLAKAINASLLLLHVLTPFDEAYPSPVFPGADGIYPMLHQQAMDNYVRQLEAFEQEGLNMLRSLSSQALQAGVVSEFSQNIGNPGKVICAMARNWDADLIIMGRRGRTGLSEIVLGSVSNYVTHHAACSVMTIQGQMTQGQPATSEATQQTTAAATLS
jgi:nucleotide-binding universal stress UspA family protein